MRIAILFDKINASVALTAVNGILGEQQVNGNRVEFQLSEGRLTPGADATVVSVHGDKPFSFFARDVSRNFPMYIPCCDAVVTEASDLRSYDTIRQTIVGLGLLTDLQKIETDAEESYSAASAATRNMTVPTWLGLSRDVRVFEAGFRGIGEIERCWDWVQPRFHGTRVGLDESGGKSVAYHYLLGRGIGCEATLERRLEGDSLPILHSTLTDGDIRYETVSFVSLEASLLADGRHSVQGTNYLVADFFGDCHVLTEEQLRRKDERIKETIQAREETVFYSRTLITNTAKVPRYAWYKNLLPNPDGLTQAGVPYVFDGANGFSAYSKDRVFAVARLNGNPLPQEELALLIHPGETATIEFRLPHQPISANRASELAAQSFEAKLADCIRWWQEKLASAADIHVPEATVRNRLKANLLHLDLVAYGEEPEGTLVPSVGVYTAIGSESSPIIQYWDSVGMHAQARRALQFFLDKQYEDGFIQNFHGYMLETGAVLWSIGEHFRYTRDLDWVRQISGKLNKSIDFLLRWRERNKKEELRGKGYGMLDGKTADPEDPFRSFMLNGYAYLGLARASELFAEIDTERSGQIAKEADALKKDIREAFREAMQKSPVVPLGNGTWVPTAPPWTDHIGPVSLHAGAGNVLTHGSAVLRDSLLGPLYLVFQEIVDIHEPEAEALLHYHSELMSIRNVAFSQPYYSAHPWVHLKRGEVKPFLKSYYNTFASLSDRETYTFWEHYYHVSPHKTHEVGWFLMHSRWMLYMEEGTSMNLLPGAPRAWFDRGANIEINRASSYFGPFSLRIDVDSEGSVFTVSIQFHEPARQPEFLDIRLPHPECVKPLHVHGGEYDSSKESVHVRSISANHAIKLIFKHPKES